MRRIASTASVGRGTAARIRWETQRVIKFIWRHPANRGRRVAAVAKAVRFQVVARLVDRPLAVRIGERSRLWARLHDHASVEVLYANPPDWPEMLVWRMLRPGDLFVDIGAHIGTYSLLAAERGAQVLAVEPDPAAAARLRANVALNAYPIQVVEAAVTDAPGSARLTVGLGERNHLLLDAVTTAASEVRSVTLDELLGENTAAGVKIDVEGAEALVLAGGARALADGRIGLLQLEWNETSLGLLGEDRSRVSAMLLQAGYTLFRPTSSGDLVPVEDPPLGRPDVFAVRASIGE